MGFTAVHAAFLGAGAAIGAGAVALGMRKRPEVPVTAPPVTATSTINKSNISAAISNENRLVYGFQDFGPTFDLLRRMGYIASYDRRLRHPAWTAEHLTAESLKRPNNDKVDRSRSVFYEDEDVPAIFRSKLNDYFKSGYDRGHMVPAADVKFSQDAMNETFALTNIAPQVGEGFNRHYWAYLEDFCRRLTGQFSDVFVFTVPLYLPKLDPTTKKWNVSYEVIGPKDAGAPSVSVPTHFAKVVLAFKSTPPSHSNASSSSSALVPASSSKLPPHSLAAFVLPNKPIPDDTSLSSFLVPVQAVEKASGLLLFNDAIKSSASHLCSATNCQLVIRKFEETSKAAVIKGSPK